MSASGGRQDHYEVLGVAPGAPDEVIRAAYRALAAKYHPDRNPGDRGAELKLKKLNAAYAVLGDPPRRKQYDELTQGPEEVTQGPPEEAAPEPPRGSTPDESNARAEPKPKAPDEPQRQSPGATERVATRAAGGFGRMLGWAAAFALVSAVAGAMRSGCEGSETHTSNAAGGYDPAPVANVNSPSNAAATAAVAQWVWTTQRDYSIAFPDAPRPAERSSENTPVGVASSTSIKLSRPSGAFYEVQQTDYPKGAVLSEQGSVDGALRGMGAAAHESPKLLSDTRAKIGECNGRAFSGSVKGFSFRTRLCVSGPHSYWAGVVFPTNPSAEDVSDGDTFLASFAVSQAPPTKATVQPQPTLPSSSSTTAAPTPQPNLRSLIAMESLCSANELCARCRNVLGPSGDCYGYLNQPAQPKTKPINCGCGDDLNCLLKCPTP